MSKRSIINWDHILPLYNWASVTKEGSLVVYEHKPIIGPESTNFKGGKWEYVGFGFDAHSWEQSLCERPCSNVIPTGDIRGIKYDSNKLQWALLPWGAMKVVVDVLMFGAKKYAPGNWKLVDNAEERYKEAAMRHLVAVLEGEWLDLESNKPHLAHLICCALFVLSLHKDTTD